MAVLVDKAETTTNGYRATGESSRRLPMLFAALATAAAQPRVIAVPVGGEAVHVGSQRETAR